MISWYLKDFTINTIFDAVIFSTTGVVSPRSINDYYSVSRVTFNFLCFWITLTNFTSLIPFKLSYSIDSRSLSMLWWTHKDNLFRILGLRQLLLFFFFFFFGIILMRTCLMNSKWLINFSNQPENGFSVLLLNHQLIQHHILIWYNSKFELRFNHINAWFRLSYNSVR